MNAKHKNDSLNRRKIYAEMARNDFYQNPSYIVDTLGAKRFQVFI